MRCRTQAWRLCTPKPTWAAFCTAASAVASPPCQPLHHHPGCGETEAHRGLPHKLHSASCTSFMSSQGFFFSLQCFAQPAPVLLPSFSCPLAYGTRLLSPRHQASQQQSHPLQGLPAALKSCWRKKKQAKHIQGNPSEAGTNLAPSPWMQFLDGHHSFPPLPPFIARTDSLAKSCVGFWKPSCLFPHLKKKKPALPSELIPTVATTTPG